MVQGFFFCGGIMANIIDAQNAFSKLLDIEIESSQNYNYIKDRVIHLPFLEQIFDSNDTIFKYNPALQAFSVIEADFLLKNAINQIPVFVFLSKDKNEKYFCKSFFTDTKKDYAERQTKWTVLFKKKIIKSSNTETVLYKHKNFK